MLEVRNIHTQSLVQTNDMLLTTGLGSSSIAQAKFMLFPVEHVDEKALNPKEAFVVGVDGVWQAKCVPRVEQVGHLFAFRVLMFKDR